MTEYELTLADRVGVIKSMNDKYDLLKNSYISFSGGKDSTILHYLVDIALPNNEIPRVFIDTGIEYNAIRKFVMSLAEKDKRFVIVKPSKPVIPTLQEFGYPFKSKQHSHDLSIYQRNGMTKSVRKYLGTEKGNNLIVCPNKLKYQFSEDFKIKVSDKCCLKMKKEPARKWERENHKTIAMTGMRKEEGGNRASLKGCITQIKRKIHFHPLLVVSDEWENEFVEKSNIELCELYKPPFNFTRTGCKGCPFSLSLSKDLETMERLMPSEKKQCELIWKPIYEEYRRINYRLKKEEQIKLF